MLKLEIKLVCLWLKHSSLAVDSRLKSSRDDEKQMKLRKLEEGGLLVCVCVCVGPRHQHSRNLDRAPAGRYSIQVENGSSRNYWCNYG